MTDPAPEANEAPPVGRLPAAGARRQGWRSFLPGIDMLAHYQRSWLPGDLAAGLVLSTLLVPVGIAYAVASGLPGINGLYATIVPLIAYALFGPSRILVLAPDSSLAAVILAVVLPLAVGDPARAVTVAGLMAIVSGLTCILVGVLRLGFITDLLSVPIRYGYMNGIALTVLVSQLPSLFGFSIESDGVAIGVARIGQGVLHGQTNWTAFLIGTGTLMAILLLKRYRRFPGILVAVVAATLLAGGFRLDEEAGIEVLGALPQGLPGLTFPWVGFEDLPQIIIGGVALALISFADTSVLSRTYAAKTRTPVDSNQEMVRLGAANLAAGLFQGFPVSASASRTPVAEASGAHSQVAGLVGALAVAGLLVWAPGLMRNLPTSALAAVVIVSAIGLFEIRDLRRIWRIQRWEFWLAAACFAGVMAFGVIPGIGLAIVIAVIEFLWDGWRPHYAVLGRVDGIAGYHDISRYPRARTAPGLVMFRWDAPLFFANAELFQQRVLQAVADSPTPVRRVVVAAEPVTSIDVTSADMLSELEESLRSDGIEFHFAEMKDPVKDKLRRFELFDQFGESAFHPTLGNAVQSYLEDHSVSWEH